MACISFCCALNERYKKVLYMKEGVFWVIPRNGATERFEMISKFNDALGHFEIWKTVVAEHPDLKKYDYEHFPRGRVWIKDSKAIIFIDARLNVPSIIAQIDKTFCLNGNYEVQAVR